jgi:hypothetical protein
MTGRTSTNSGPEGNVGIERQEPRNRFAHNRAGPRTRNTTTRQGTAEIPAERL